MGRKDLQERAAQTEAIVLWYICPKLVWPMNNLGLRDCVSLLKKKKEHEYLCDLLIVSSMLSPSVLAIAARNHDRTGEIMHLS